MIYDLQKILETKTEENRPRVPQHTVFQMVLLCVAWAAIVRWNDLYRSTRVQGKRKTWRVKKGYRYYIMIRKGDC